VEWKQASQSGEQRHDTILGNVWESDGEEEKNTTLSLIDLTPCKFTKVFIVVYIYGSLN